MKMFVIGFAVCWVLFGGIVWSMERYILSGADKRFGLITLPYQLITSPYYLVMYVKERKARKKFKQGGVSTPRKEETEAMKNFQNKA